MTRTNRSIASFASLLLLQVTTVTTGIFSTPLLLHWLGDERYGAFRAATDVTGYILLFEMGLGGALNAMLANVISQGDRDQVRITLGCGVRAYLRVLCLMLLAGVGLGCLIPHLVPIQHSLVRELQMGYWIGLLNMLLIPLNPFHLLADASQRTYFKSFLLITQGLLITGLLLLFSWLGWGIPGQFLAALIGNAFVNITLSWDGLRRYPDVVEAIIHPPKAISQQVNQRLWSLNVPNLVLHLAGRVGLLTDNVIVSFYLGPAAVVPFLITQRLASLAQMQIQAVGGSTWAALADLHTQGARDEFNTRLVDLTKIVVIVGLTVMIPITAYNAHFVTLWMGADRFGGWAVNLLAAANGLLRGVLFLWESCFMGTGTFPKLVRLSIFGTLVNGGISLVATHQLGMIGPLLGTFISAIALYAWLLPRLLHSVFGTSPRQLFWAIAQPLKVGIPYAVVVIGVAASHTPYGWLGLAGEMGCVALLYLVLVWHLVLNPQERLVWGQRLSGMMAQIRLRAFSH